MLGRTVPCYNSQIDVNMIWRPKKHKMDVHVSMWGSTEAGRIGQMFCCVFSTLGSALSPVWRLSLKVWQFTTWRKKGRMIFTTKLREERKQDFLQIYSWVKCTQTAGSWNVIKTLFKVFCFWPAELGNLQKYSWAREKLCLVSNQPTLKCYHGSNSDFED